MAIDITALYCCLDDFCKVFEDWEAHRLIPSQTTRQRTGKLSRSEMLFIMVLFHLSPFKHFKVFYHYGIGQQHRACFRELPHYDRFVGLMPRLFAPLMVLPPRITVDWDTSQANDFRTRGDGVDDRRDRHRIP